MFIIYRGFRFECDTPVLMCASLKDVKHRVAYFKKHNILHVQEVICLGEKITLTSLNVESYEGLV